MTRNPAIAVLLGLFVCTPVSLAQEAVTVKLKMRGEGESILVAKTSTSTAMIKITDGEKALRDLNETETEAVEFRETVQKRDAAKEPTKLERKYTKWQRIKGGKTTDSPLHDKTIIIEKIDGKFNVIFKDGEPVVGQEATGLQKEFGKKAELVKLMLPTTAVKPGESWKLDLPKILKEFAKDGDLDIDAAKAVGTGTLLKTHTKDGKTFGVMEFKISVPVIAFGKGLGQYKFTEPAKMNYGVYVDACIDGTSEAGTTKFSMIVNGSGTLPNLPGYTVTASIVAVESIVLREPGKK
jgi:hypothetical protein